MAEFARFVRAVGGTWIAHNGGRFDHLLLMNYLDRASRIYMTGSGILKALWLKSDKAPQLELRDSFPWWLASLEKVGKGVGLDKFVGTEMPLRDFSDFAPIDRSHLEKFEPSAVVEYCRVDVDILRAGIIEARKAQKRLARGRAWTSGGTAVGVLRKLEHSAWVLLKSKYTLDPDDVETLHAMGLVHGGRVEVFRYGKLQNVYRYDISSSYPKSYFEGALPVGHAGCNIATNPRLSGPPWSNVLASWKRSDNSVPAPLLCAGGQGTGEMRRWLTREQYQWLSTLPEIENLTPEKYVYPQAYMEIGRDFATALYVEKEHGPASWCGKVWLNSLHGRASMHAEQSYFEPDPKGPGYVETIEMVSDPFQQPLMASWILGRAELRLSKMLLALRDAGFEVYYCDTDCISTNATPDQFDTIARTIGQQIGEGIGCWKKENFSKVAYYIAPKVYLEGKTRKAKGVKSSDLDYAALWRGKKPQLLRREGLTGARSTLLKGHKVDKCRSKRTVQIVARGKRLTKGGRCVYV